MKEEGDSQQRAFIAEVIGKYYEQTTNKLRSFTKEWLATKPECAELISSAKVLLNPYVHRLTPGTNFLSGNFQEHVVLYSVNPRSGGFYDSMYNDTSVGGFASTSKEDLEPLGLKDYGVLIRVDNNEAKSRFGFVLFHECFHLMIIANEELKGYKHHDDYNFIEEGYVSYLARGVLNSLAVNSKNEGFRTDLDVDPPQLVLSVLLDRLVSFESSRGKSLEMSYYDVFEDGISALMLAKNKDYIKELFRGAFSDEEENTYHGKLAEISQYRSAKKHDLEARAALELYNLIGKYNFESWPDCLKWRKERDEPPFRALYAPLKLMMHY